MKIVILAAGEGSRLRPYTSDRPKCMVEFQGKPMIDYTFKNIIENNVGDVVIVTGYKENVLKKYVSENYDLDNIKIYSNPNYDETNMVSTLFCAEEELDEDIIISYSDIVYKRDILEKLIDSKEDICVVVDRDWKKLWEYRMDNPLDDAETLKINSEGNISEIGKKPESYDEIEGQYMGLIKVSKNKIREIVGFYKNLSREELYDGKDFANMYMTSFIQLLIDDGFKVTPLYIGGGWVEIDTTEDLENLKLYKI